MMYKSIKIIGLLFIVQSSLYAQMTSSGWVSTITGTGFETVSDVQSDFDGNVIVIGRFIGTTSFGSGALAESRTSTGGSDVFIAKYTGSGDLQWVVTVGGTDDDFGYGIDVDPNGFIYAVGSFRETVDFDPGTGVLNLSSEGRDDIFILKLTPGGELNLARRIGGSSVDEANDIALDSQGDMYITGRFTSTVDFDPGAGTENRSAGSRPDAFILKLNNSAEFIYAYDIGAGDNEEGETVAVDNDNNVIIGGLFSGNVDFDPSAGTRNLNADGINDPFFLKLSPNGTFMWVRSFESSGFDYCGDIAIDRDNNILVHGHFREQIDFDPQGAGRSTVSAGAEDSYTAKFTPQGVLDWVNVIPGDNIEFGYGVAVDARGDVYVTGLFYDSPDFDPSSEIFLMPSAGIEDTYLVKYASDGSFIWGKKTGGSGSDAGYGVDLSPAGDILLTGNYFQQSDLDPELDAILNVTSRGGSDIFILKINQLVSSIDADARQTNSFTLGPNPTQGILVINQEINESYTYTVIDMSGKVVVQSDQVNELRHELDLLPLSHGLYTICITQGKNAISIPFVKVH